MSEREKQKDVAVACVPCGIGHFSTSAGVLNEAVRFKKEGLTSQQVLDRIAVAIKEQNALERVDLTPEKMRKLPEWEKSLAEAALLESRNLRHKLEKVSSMKELEGIAADTDEFYKKLNREWNTKRLEECPTCSIDEEEEETPEEQVDLSRYGADAAEKRKRFLEEVRAEAESPG